jgi:hypothetical protein
LLPVDAASGSLTTLPSAKTVKPADKPAEKPRETAAAPKPAAPKPAAPKKPAPKRPDLDDVLSGN